MSHIDTLKVYKELLAGGMTPDQAQLQVNAYEAMSHTFFNELKEWLREAKQEFASQKLVSTIGGLILLVGVGVIGLLWHVTVDMEKVKSELQHQSAQIQQLSLRDN